MKNLGAISQELVSHAPFTAIGAVTGIVIMVGIELLQAPEEISRLLFYTLHPLHIVFSALVTTSMYRIYKQAPLWKVILVGYTGSVGIATISDSIIPFLGGEAMTVSMQFHLPFLEGDPFPYLGVPIWVVVNGAAIIGIFLACWHPNTRFPHLGHVLLSTWASLFGFTAFGVANWLPLLPLVFVFLFLAVWVPCCISDIVYPLLFVGKIQHHHHHH